MHTVQMGKMDSMKATLKERLTSVESWRLEKTDSAFVPEGRHSNYDMEPVPVSILLEAYLLY